MPEKEFIFICDPEKFRISSGIQSKNLKGEMYYAGFGRNNVQRT